MRVVIRESQIRKAILNILLEQAGSNFIANLNKANLSGPNKQDVIRLLNLIFFNISPDSQSSSEVQTDDIAAYGTSYSSLMNLLNKGSLEPSVLLDVLALYVASRFAGRNLDNDSLVPVTVGTQGSISPYDVVRNINMFLQRFGFSTTFNGLLSFLEEFLSGGLYDRLQTRPEGAPPPEATISGVATALPTGLPDEPVSTFLIEDLAKEFVAGCDQAVLEQMKETYEWTAGTISPIATKADEIVNKLSTGMPDSVTAGELLDIAKLLVKNHETKATYPGTAMRSSNLASFALVNSVNRGYERGLGRAALNVFAFGITEFLAWQISKNAFVNFGNRVTSYFWNDIKLIDGRIKNFSEKMAAVRAQAASSKQAEDTARYIEIEKKVIEIEDRLFRNASEIVADDASLFIRKPSIFGGSAPRIVDGRLEDTLDLAKARGDLLKMQDDLELWKMYDAVETAATQAANRLKKRGVTAPTPVEIRDEMTASAQSANARFYEKWFINSASNPMPDRPSQSLIASIEKSIAKRGALSADEAELARKAAQKGALQVPSYRALEAEANQLQDEIAKLETLKSALAPGSSVSDADIQTMYQAIGGAQVFRKTALNFSRITMGIVIHLLTYAATSLIYYHFLWKNTLSPTEQDVAEELNFWIARNRSEGTKLVGNSLAAFFKDWSGSDIIDFELTREFGSFTGAIDEKLYRNLAMAGQNFANEAVTDKGVTPGTLKSLVDAIETIEKAAKK